MAEDTSGNVRNSEAGRVRCRVDSFYSSVNTGDENLITASPRGAAESGHLSFAFEDLSHPNLKTLREKYGLADVIAPGKTEIEKMALLRNWVKLRWKHTIPRVFPRWDALEILELADKGEKFYCVQSSLLLVQCAQAVGWQARKLEIHDHTGNDHSVIEVWSNDFNKWVIMDPDFNAHYERGGVPLGALELRKAWLARRIDDIEVKRMDCPYGFDANKGADIYLHFYIVWRNDFFGRPDAPIRLLHFTDEAAGAQVVDDGKLLFPDPQLFGPRYPYVDGAPGYMRPFSLDTGVATDGDKDTAWVADNDGKAHFIELEFPTPRPVETLVIHWPRASDTYVASKEFTILMKEDDGWQPLIEGDLEPAEAAFPITLPIPPGTYAGVRIESSPDPEETTSGPSFGVAEIEVQ
ncbi:MAG: discoidin domain-containing protein [Planctomycetota bacterium]